MVLLQTALKLPNQYAAFSELSSFAKGNTKSENCNPCLHDKE